jgi:WD40 repeat protein
MTIIRWIHFSDLHLNETGVETKRLRKKLIEYLRGLNLHCEYAFFTGDMRYAPFGAFPDGIVEYMSEVCDAVNVPLERLFVVPGNHDVDRDCSERADAIKQVFDSGNGYYVPLDGAIKENDLKTIAEGQQDFRQVISGLYKGVPGREAFYDDFRHPHFCITTDDLNIVHVDSTIAYAENRERDLFVGTGALMDVLDKCDSSKPTFLITHYSYDYLHRDEQNQILQLLQDYHVKVWIAGHEHDHLCRQQRDYFYELQCGNLVLESGAKSCVLIGELDLTTGDAVVRAHAWFAQGGWAPYPFIRTGKEDNTVYPFALTLPGSDSALHMSMEERNILEVCRSLENPGGPFYGVHFQNELMPDLQWNTDIFHNMDDKTPLIKAIFSLWEKKRKDASVSWHALLLGDGGMGKSTMLFYSCRQLVKEHRLTVYASLNMLQTENLTIESKILMTLYRAENEVSRNKLVRLLSNEVAEPKLMLMVDGFNELNSDSAYRYASEIKQLAMYPGIQIIVSSRLDFLRYYGMSHFQMLNTCDLRDEQIRVLFEDENVWQDILNKRELHILLKNPMMALLYAQISPVIEKYKDLDYCEWKRPVCNASDLMHNYYMAQVALTIERSSEVGKAIYVNYCAVRYILPYLAYQAEASNRMAWSHSEFEKVFAAAVRDAEEYIQDDETMPENLIRIKRCYRVRMSDKLPQDSLEDAIISELCLVRDNGTGYAFKHQIYRDYLAAVYFADDLEISGEKSDIWRNTHINEGVAQYLQHIHGELWGSDGLMTQKLLPYRGQVISDGDFYVENLLNCWLSENRSFEDERDLSGLDLRRISLAKHLKLQYKGTIILDNAKVSRRTFINEQRHDCIVDLAFSHDGRMLAAVSSNGIVSVSNILTQSQMIVGEIEICGDTEVYYTAEDYLYLKTGEKSYKWPTISYDKMIEVGAEERPIHQIHEKEDDDEADKLYKILEDSDMLGSRTVISEQRVYIAVGYHSGHIQIWNVADQTVAAELTLGDGQVVTASFTQNGEIAAIGAGNTIVQLWNIKDGRCLGAIHFDRPVHKVRFPAEFDFAKQPYLECEYSDGNYIRINIRTWKSSESKSRKEVLRIQKKLRDMLKNENVKKIDVASNNNAIIQLNNSKQLYVWNHETEALNLCNGHGAKVQYAEICDADPRYAASYSGEIFCGKGKQDRKFNGKRIIRTWAVRKGNCMQRLIVDNRTIQHIQFFTTNRIILAAFATNGDILMWELTNKRVYGEERGHWDRIDTVRKNSGEPVECAVSTQEKLFIGVNADGTMFSRTFDGEEKNRFRIFPGIDPTHLKWENIECDDELKSILATYRSQQDL